jgi:ubiquinone/menaquinone biosynthesis C-methylase UbiE
VWVAPRMLEHFTAAPGMRVLDLGTGVGAMAAALARRHPGIELWGLDLRAAQLSQAQALHPVATYVQGDASRMPFPDASFDRVHASWVMEHIPEPAHVLGEVRRILVPGGQCFFLEVDNATVRLVPPSPEIDAALALLNRAQLQGGGDPFIGQKLEGLMRAAGFSDVQVNSVAIDGDVSDPETLRSSAEEVAEIFESLDEALGLDEAPLLHAAARAARALPHLPGAEFHFRPVTAVGTR